MSVSLILPYYNPPANWAVNIVERFSILKKQIDEPITLVLVNDGSNYIASPGIEHIKSNIQDCIFISYEDNHGKGYAIRQGVKQAEGDIIIYTDVDFPYTIESICEIYRRLKDKGADVAMGVKNKSYYKAVPSARRAISKILRWMIRNFFTIPYSDTQCGLKGFKKHVKPLFLKTSINRYLFDLEFIRNSHKQGYKIEAVPVVLNEGVEFRKVNYHILLPEVANLVKLMLK